MIPISAYESVKLHCNIIFNMFICMYSYIYIYVYMEWIFKAHPLTICARLRNKKKLINVDWQRYICAVKINFYILWLYVSQNIKYMQRCAFLSPTKFCVLTNSIMENARRKKMEYNQIKSPREKKNKKWWERKDLWLETRAVLQYRRTIV